MEQKLIYKNENIKRYKSKFKKDQDRVYTSFSVDRNTKYKGWQNSTRKTDRIGYLITIRMRLVVYLTTFTSLSK